jgi:AcrR family transcriptional regulator
MPKQDEGGVPGLIAPVQGRSKLSTRRLLEAAGEVIAERGYEQASLAAIGERAGYSRGLVTTRFGTKENLLTVLMERITSTWIEHNVLPEIEGLPGLDAMLTYLDTVIEQLERDPEAMRILWALSFEAARASSPLREHFEPYHRATLTTITAFLRNGIEDGSVDPDVDPEREALLYTATLRGMAYHWLLVGDGDEALALFRSFREQSAHAYLPGPRKRRRRSKTLTPAANSG